MLYAQRPSSFYGFPAARPQRYSYTEEPRMSSEQYYRQLAAEHRRDAARALQLAQQEREDSIRRREAEALRYRQELARCQSQHQPSAIAPCACHPTSRARPTRPQQQRPQRWSWNPATAHQRRQPEERDPGYQAFASQFLRAMSEENEENEEEEPTRPAKKVHFEQSEQPAEARKPSQDDFLSGTRGRLNDQRQEAFLRQLGILPQQSSRQAPARRTTPEAKRPSPQPQTTQTMSQSIPLHISTPTPSTPSSPHSTSFSSLDKIESQFNTLKSSFIFPSHLDFEPSSKEFVYNSHNAPVRQYESDLIKLLTRLDAVESDGSESVRGARKAVVKAIEAELDRLEGLKEEAWRAQNEETVVEESAPAEEDVVVDEVSAEAEVSPVAAVTTSATMIASASATDALQEYSAPAPVAEASSEHLRLEPENVPLPSEEMEVEDLLTDSSMEVEPASEQSITTVVEASPDDSVGPSISADVQQDDDAQSGASEDELAHSVPVIIEDTNVVLPDAESSSSEDEALSDEASSVDLVEDEDSVRGEGDDFEML